MEYSGSLRKMRTKLIGTHAHYTLPIGEEKIDMSQLIGKNISFHYQGDIFCIKCGAKTKKSFAQGFCYSCFITAPETEECVLRPELCQAHNGIARDMEYAKQHCLSDQYVYLAVSSGLKVGVTRSSQIPTRWIDQGASYAMIIAIAPNRHTAGLIEVALKDIFADKTNWQRMLKNQLPAPIDLAQERERAKLHLPESLRSFIIQDKQVQNIVYPVLQYPQKIKAVNFDKEADFEGKFAGIKGQYMLFGTGHVLNVRKFAGYATTLSF